jgi:lysophospholipase L1-like esterase
MGVILLSASATDPADSHSAPVNNPRLQQALAKLRRGETISVVAIGGSITTGHQARPPATEGWAGQVNRWFQEQAAATGGKVVFHNAGASGTDSAFGAIRIQDHVLAYEPDLVIVEFAINDQWLSQRVRQRSYEGVLRQLLAGSDRAVVLLALNEKANPNKSTRVEEERIGSHYGLPTLAWADWVKLADWDRYFTGAETIHPNNDGHGNIAAGITGYFGAVLKSLPPDDAIPAIEVALPQPLVSSEFQKVTLIGGNDAASLAEGSEGWETCPGILPDEWLTRGGAALTGWTSRDPAADLRILVRGKSVGILFAESDQFCNGLAWIEGMEDRKTVIKSYVSYRSGYYGYAYAEVADNLDPSKEYILHLGLNSGGKSGASTSVTGVICTQP